MNDYRELQQSVATGVTDGTLSPYKLIEDLTDVIRHTPSRNDVLEEVAQEFDNMKVFGDTAASFAIFVREMKS